jgi:flagellar biosynthesis regulator FlaF
MDALTAEYEKSIALLEEKNAAAARTLEDTRKFMMVQTHEVRTELLAREEKLTKELEAALIRYDVERGKALKFSDEGLAANTKSESLSRENARLQKQIDEVMLMLNAEQAKNRELFTALLSGKSDLHASAALHDDHKPKEKSVGQRRIEDWVSNACKRGVDALIVNTAKSVLSQALENLKGHQFNAFAKRQYELLLRNQDQAMAYWEELEDGADWEDIAQLLESSSGDEP